LSANLADDRNLDGHLLPGLEPKGVPRCLVRTSFPFNYNKIEELEDIVRENKDIGVIVVEPVRHQQPTDDFLGKIRKIANRIGAVLIFDEITSGWRMNVGGIHELYGVHPDVAVYAKAISNGFPMGAIVGKAEVMDIAQETFISSTAWTERVGPIASVATIKKMQKNDVPSHLCRIGDLISNGWRRLAESADLKINVMGIPPLTTFAFEHKENQALQTLFTQEMLNRGFLASKSVYVSFSHTEENVERYLENADRAFGTIRKALESGNVQRYLKGPVAQAGFRRLA
jgi:glutamate-1-semialdehyde aminotransferase